MRKFALMALVAMISCFGAAAQIPISSPAHFAELNFDSVMLAHSSFAVSALEGTFVPFPTTPYEAFASVNVSYAGPAIDSITGTTASGNVMSAKFSALGQGCVKLDFFENGTKSYGIQLVGCNAKNASRKTLFKYYPNEDYNISVNIEALDSEEEDIPVNERRFLVQVTAFGKEFQEIVWHGKIGTDLFAQIQVERAKYSIDPLPFENFFSLLFFAPEMSQGLSELLAFFGCRWGGGELDTCSAGLTGNIFGGSITDNEWLACSFAGLLGDAFGPFGSAGVGLVCIAVASIGD
jgi:hypothetical protein